MINNPLRLFVIVMFIGIVPLQSLDAQSLRERLESVFEETLSPDNLFLGPFNHGEHFRPSSSEATAATIGTFSNFISANISSFPLSSTAAGLTFDFSGSAPISTSTSLGPIFSERAQTLGRNKLNMGFSFSYLNFTKLRGVDTDDLRFTFFHEDVGGPGGPGPSGTIGDDPNGNEFDTIELRLNSDFSASIFSFVFTYGLTNRMDIGLAIPYITVSMKGTPSARVIPRTALSRQDTASHHWGDENIPQYAFEPTPLNDDAVGIGDIAIRAKYNFVRNDNMDFAGLVEYRPSSGDKDDFLGAGDPSLRFQMIFSTIRGNFAPHINIAYENRGSSVDRDEIELFLGYDQKLTDWLTLGIDFMGEFEIGDEVAELRFPEPLTIQGAGPWAAFTETVSATNIPEFTSDHNINAAFGFKLNPKQNLIIISNVFMPLNDGGLRSSFIPTAGFEFIF